MPRTAKEAIAWSEAQVRANKRSWHNLCLMHVRSAFGAPAMGGNAALAWDWIPATRRRPGDTSPPRGVPVFWGGGQGHVVLSLGGGRCITNDQKRDGYLDYSTLAEVSRWLGPSHPYRGWADYINKTPVVGYGDQRPLIHPSIVIRAAEKGTPASDVRQLKQVLKRRGFKGLYTRNTTGGRKWGRNAKRAWKQIQIDYCKRHGVPVNRRTCDGIPGPKSITWYAKKTGAYRIG